MHRAPGHSRPAVTTLPLWQHCNQQELARLPFAPLNGFCGPLSSAPALGGYTCAMLRL